MDDGITSSMLKNASPLAISYLTNLYNEMFRTGTVPNSLLSGKMTLTDKKKPSLYVSGKRPLNVSSVIMNLFTKIIHQRTDKISEEEGFYGPIQYGFRSGRSTADCVFILLSAIRKAKQKNQQISLAFVT